MGFSAFNSHLISYIHYASRGVAAVLEIVIDPLTRKTFGGVGTLVSLNGDVEVKQVVYFKDFFEI